MISRTQLYALYEIFVYFSVILITQEILGLYSEIQIYPLFSETSPDGDLHSTSGF